MTTPTTSRIPKKKGRFQHCQRLFLQVDLKFCPEDTKTRVDSHHDEGIM
jgi:hypothetical protein